MCAYPIILQWKKKIREIRMIFDMENSHRFWSKNSYFWLENAQNLIIFIILTTKHEKMVHSILYW